MWSGNPSWRCEESANNGVVPLYQRLMRQQTITGPGENSNILVVLLGKAALLQSFGQEHLWLSVYQGGLMISLLLLLLYVAFASPL